MVIKFVKKLENLFNDQEEKHLRRIVLIGLKQRIKLGSVSVSYAHPILV